MNRKGLMNFESFLEATEHDEGGKGIVVTYNNHITETQHDLSKVLDLSILHEEGFGIMFKGDTPRNDVRLGIHLGQRYNEINDHLPDLPILAYDMLQLKAPVAGGFLIQPHAKQVIRGGFSMGLRDSFRVRDKQFETIQGEADFETVLVQTVQELINNGYELYHGGKLDLLISRYFEGLEMVDVHNRAARLFEETVGHGAHYAYILHKKIELEDIRNGSIGAFDAAPSFPKTADSLLETLEGQRKKS